MTDPKPKAPALMQLGQTVMGGLVIAGMAVAFAISFAAIVYSGPMAGSLEQGIAHTLLATVAMLLVGAALFSYRGTLCQPQDVTAIVLAGAAPALFAAAEPGTGAASMSMLIVVAALLTGVAALLCGWFRLGFLARFIPHAVIGGFLSATGYLLVMGAIGMILGEEASLYTLGALLRPEALMRWLPWIAAAAAVTALCRRIASPLTLSACLVALLVLFYAVLALRGISLAEAQAAGLMLGPFSGGGLLGALNPAMAAQADYGAIAAQAPALVAVVALALLGTLLNTTAIEMTVAGGIDLERDLRATGWSNLASGALGGLPGFPLLGETLLSARLGLRGPIGAFAAAGGCLAALLFGAGLLSLLPVGLFAAVIAYLGFDLLVDWLWGARSRLGRADYALILLVLAVAALASFLAALATGLVAAVLFFLHAYARIGVVRLRATGASLRSRVERSAAENAVLGDAGSAVVIVQLEGYLFFGTANGLLTRLRDELTGDPPPQRFILDFARVTGVDGSAAESLRKIAAEGASAGCQVVFAGLPAPMRAGVARALHGTAPSFAPSLDAALEEAEDALLAGTSGAPPGDPDLWQALEALAGGPIVQEITLAPGDVLLRQGSPGREVYLLCSGLIEARTPDGLRLSSVRPGAVIGEMAYFTGAPRSADLAAAAPARLLRIDPAALDAADPALARRFERQAAAGLARRLDRMTGLLREAGL